MALRRRICASGGQGVKTENSLEDVANALGAVGGSLMKVGCMILLLPLCFVVFYILTEVASSGGVP